MKWKLGLQCFALNRLLLCKAFLLFKLAVSVRCERWFTSINHQHHLHLYMCVVSKGPGHWEFPQWFEPQGDVLSVCTGEECGLSAGATARTDGGRELKPRQRGQERWKGLHRRQQSLTVEYQFFAFTTIETINMVINTSAFFWFCLQNEILLTCDPTLTCEFQWVLS